MKKKNCIILVGFGKSGKRYFKIIKKKRFDIIVIRKSTKKIIYKKKNISFKSEDIKKISLENVNLVIIATPLESHWKYLNFFLRKKVDILIEKPVIRSKSHFFKLSRLIKKYKNNFYINHSDLYNKNFLSLIENIDYKKIQKISFNYGNNKNKYKSNKKIFPTTDWLPHILCIIIFFLKKISNYKISYFHRKIKNNLIYEKTLIKFYSKNVLSKVFFSNFPGTKLRNFILESPNFRFNFDGLKNNNYIINSGKKIVSQHNPKRTYDNLINIILSNRGKKKYNDFYYFRSYFMIWNKINIQLSKL
jgi:hypothetical protein